MTVWATREGLFFLQGFFACLAILGVGLNVYFSQKSTRLYEEAIRGFKKMMVIMIDLLDNYSQVVKTLDTNNQYPDYHGLDDSLVKTREEYKKEVGAG